MSVKLVERCDNVKMRVRASSIDDLRTWLTMQAIECDNHATQDARSMHSDPHGYYNASYHRMKAIARYLRMLRDHATREFSQHDWNNAAYAMMRNPNITVLPDDALIPSNPNDAEDAPQ
jgi:hypothetical protein